ncbi:MAG: hypothetical protein AAF902_19280, partial [Chloroflexota bacterium]
KNRIKQTLKSIENILVRHLKKIDERKEYMVSENFEVWIWPTSIKFESAYVLGSSMDDDATGSAEVIRTNLEWILPEKTNKIKKYSLNYSKWWLVMIDHIGGAKDELYDPILPLKNDLRADWEKVICVSPYDTKKWREVTFN